MRPDNWSFSSAYSGCGRFLRLGLRIANGTQWSDSVEWQRTSNIPLVDERGVTKNFRRGGSTHIIANYYAFNGRTSASYTNQCGSDGVVSWNGYTVF